MSFWLNLIPKLNSPNARTPTQNNGQNFEHHLLPDHEDMDTYEGIVRESLFKHYHTPAPSSDKISKIIVNSTKSDDRTNKMADKSENNLSKNESNQLVVMDGSNVDENSNSDKKIPDADTRAPEVTTTSSTIYSSALSAIVILGCTFLLLNVLICLRLLYKEDQANHGIKRSLGGSGGNGNGARSKRSKRRSSTLTSLNDQVSVARASIFVEYSHLLQCA